MRGEARGFSIHETHTFIAYTCRHLQNSLRNSIDAAQRCKRAEQFYLGYYWYLFAKSDLCFVYFFSPAQ